MRVSTLRVGSVAGARIWAAYFIYILRVCRRRGVAFLHKSPSYHALGSLSSWSLGHSDGPCGTNFLVKVFAANLTAVMSMERRSMNFGTSIDFCLPYTGGTSCTPLARPYGAC
mmetsp:Transcript_4419/g.6596  ORF Transcript_4419/g.6596 Transcript_4419/m.6596 type:complete len:113 (-) Transcript_4419:52-390(-)